MKKGKISPFEFRVKIVLLNIGEEITPFKIRVKTIKSRFGVSWILPRWGGGKNQEGKLGNPKNSCCIYKFWLFVNWLDYGFIWHFCGTDYYMLSFLIRIWSIFWSWIIMKMVKVWETEPHKWLMVPRLIVISEDNCHVRGIKSSTKDWHTKPCRIFKNFHYFF